MARTCISSELDAGFSESGYSGYACGTGSGDGSVNARSVDVVGSGVERFDIFGIYDAADLRADVLLDQIAFLEEKIALMGEPAPAPEVVGNLHFARSPLVQLWA